jgi:hypothetical protein
VRFASTSARALAAVVVLAGAAAALLAAGACLPDLAAIGAEDASFESSTAPFQGCGDGVIATLDDGGDAGESCDPGPDAGAVPGCSACQINCDEGRGDPKTGHCYFVAGAATTYAAASAQCTAARAHLVTFVSEDEVELVREIAADESGYWVGLARKDSELSGAYGPDRLEEPGFPYPLAPVDAAAGPCPGCFGVGVDPDAGVFPVDDASASGAASLCVASRAGSWLQVPCNGSVNRPTVCEREPAGLRGQPCGNDGICFTVAQTAGAKTYLVVVSAADPITAATTCGFLDGGSLVILDSREEREQLAHEIAARYPGVEQPLWIGLHADGGAWTWDDGLAAAAGGTRPLPWGNAQPMNAASNARAFLRVGASTYDTQLAYADDGGASHLFVCQRPAR